MTVIITLTLFSLLVLHAFQRNLKKDGFFDYNDVNFNTQPSPIKHYAMFQNSVIIE